jgi:hypothetical protein
LIGFKQVVFLITSTVLGLAYLGKVEWSIFALCTLSLILAAIAESIVLEHVKQLTTSTKARKVPAKVHALSITKDFLETLRPLAQILVIGSLLVGMINIFVSYPYVPGILDVFLVSLCAWGFIENVISIISKQRDRAYQAMQ